MHILCLAYHLVCFTAKGAKTKHRRTERRTKWKALQQRTFSHACPACPFVQRFDTVWEVLGTIFFGTIALMEFVLKNLSQQLCSFSLAPHARPVLLPPQAIHASQSIHARPALPSRSLQRGFPQAISTLHSPPAPVRRFRLAPSSGAPPKLFPRFTVHHACPAIPSRSLQRSSPKLFPRFTVHHASPAIPSRSLQRSSPQAISTLHTQSITLHHARPALPSRSLQRRSPQAISKLFPRFPLRPRSCLPSFLPPSLPSFLPSFPSFLPYFLPLFPLSFLPSFPLVPSFLPCSSGSSENSPRGKVN